jgi:hypothetical protein
MAARPLVLYLNISIIVNSIYVKYSRHGKSPPRFPLVGFLSYDGRLLAGGDAAQAVGSGLGGGVGTTGGDATCFVNGVRAVNRFLADVG